MRSIAVLSEIPHLSYHLHKVLPSVTFCDVVPDSQDSFSHLFNSEIVIADANLLISHVDNLPRTKWVQVTWAGVETLVDSMKNKNLPFKVTRFSGDCFGYAMSEYVVSHIVNFERDHRKQFENQSKCLWNINGKIQSHRRLSDLTIGVLGLGEIGKFIVKTLKVFGAAVWGVSRTLPVNQIENLDKHFTLEGLPEVLKNCDYIVNVLPSTPNTKGLLNGDTFKNCSVKKSVFINIGRGSVVKETDLINALEKNWISGAILDVFEDEPLNEKSKLWKFPQVIISPHVAGVSRPDDIAKVFLENYNRYSKGESLKNIINVYRGY